MTKFLITFSFLIIQNAFAMGKPRLFPNNSLSLNEIQLLNDDEETTAKLNQVTQDRGHHN